MRGSDETETPTLRVLLGSSRGDGFHGRPPFGRNKYPKTPNIKEKTPKPFLMISLFEIFELEARFDDLKTKSHSEAENTSKAPSSSILHFVSPNEIWNIIFRLPHSFQSDSTNPKSTFELVIQRKGFNLIISCLSFQSSVVFDLLKAHLKRAPSLRGAALVRLASLKFQAEPWPPLIYNKSEALARLDEVR